MNNTSKTLLAVVSGAAIGAGLAILFAPASGKETRGKIKDKASQAKDGINDLVNKGKSMFNGVKKEAEEIVANANETLKQANPISSANSSSRQRERAEL